MANGRLQYDDGNGSGKNLSSPFHLHSRRHHSLPYWRRRIVIKRSKLPKLEKKFWAIPLCNRSHTKFNQLSCPGLNIKQQTRFQKCNITTKCVKIVITRTVRCWNALELNWIKFKNMILLRNNLGFSGLKFTYRKHSDWIVTTNLLLNDSTSNVLEKFCCKIYLILYYKQKLPTLSFRCKLQTRQTTCTSRNLPWNTDGW